MKKLLLILFALSTSLLFAEEKVYLQCNSGDSETLTAESDCEWTADPTDGVNLSDNKGSSITITPGKVAKVVTVKATKKTSKAETECGKWTVYVYEIKLQAKADNPTPKKRKIFGVCENATVEIKPTEIIDKLTVSDPSGKVQCKRNDDSYLLEMGDQESDVALKYTVAGKESEDNIRIIKPSQISMKVINKSFKKHHYKDQNVYFYTYKMETEIFCGPNNVNFENIKIGENSTEGAIVDGYFTGKSIPHLERTLYGFSEFDPQKGFKCSKTDNIELGTNQAVPPISNGNFTWKIPWVYQSKKTDTPRIKFEEYNHEMCFAVHPAPMNSGFRLRKAGAEAIWTFWIGANGQYMLRDDGNMDPK